jgi:hypothetical protein
MHACMHNASHLCSILSPYHWHPRWLSVLTVSPSSNVEVNMGSLWTGMGALETSLMGAQEVGEEVCVCVCVCVCV